MRLKKSVVCSIAIASFLFVQSTAIAQTKSSSALKGAEKVTHNAPQIKTTTPEPIAAGEATGGKKKVLWGVLGAAAVIGLIAAVVGGGSSGGGDDNGKTTTEETGSVQVEW